MLIIIQGPYSKYTRDLAIDISNLFPKIKIKISCYKEIINEILFENNKNIEVIRNQDPGSIRVPPRGKLMNLHRQAKTTLSACVRSDEEWVIKIRSDMQIVNKTKFTKSIHKFINCIESPNPPKLITLENGSLDIFSYYDMPFHFSDWFFMCRREVLLKNCQTLLNIDENSLVQPFLKSFPNNYYHSKRYRMVFHNEQLIHFANFLLDRKYLEFCCDTRKLIIKRHIIWVAKYLQTFNLKEIGIKSSKVGYPSFGSKLVGISFKSGKLYKLILKSKGFSRIAFLIILKIHGLFRKFIFMILILNRSFISFILNKKSYLKNLFFK